MLFKAGRRNNICSNFSCLSFITVQTEWEVSWTFLIFLESGLNPVDPCDRDSNFAGCIFLLSYWPDGGMGIILKPTPGSRIDYFFRKTMFTYLPLAGICLGCIKFSFVWELLHLQRVFLKVPNLDFSNLPTWISQTCQPGFLLQPAATAPACAGHIAPGQEGILQGIREI